MDISSDETAESAVAEIDNTPVVDNKEKAECQNRLLSFVGSTEEEPHEVGGHDRGKWLDRIEYTQRRNRYAHLRRQHSWVQPPERKEDDDPGSPTDNGL